MQTLGQEIKRLRLKTGISLRQFAELINISPAHQSDIEHDRRYPSEAVLRKIAQALKDVGVTYEALASLDMRIEPEIRQWILQTPGVKELLRVIKESGKDPREILKKLQLDLES